MAASLDLGLAFLEAHPQDAARVLETLPVADARDLFAVVPSRIGAPVLTAMLAPAAARILEVLPEAQAAALAAHARAQSLVSILRHQTEPTRARLLAGLPAGTAVGVRLLLGFPDDTVGAWTDTSAAIIPAKLDAGGALALLRTLPEAGSDPICVVDAQRHLVGCVGLHALLRADARTAAGTLARPAAGILSATMPLASARTEGPWERAPALPVVDHDRRLVGVLRRADLARAVRVRERPPGSSVAGALAAGYWSVVSGLSAAALGMLPRVRRVLPEDR